MRPYCCHRWSYLLHFSSVKYKFLTETFKPAMHHIFLNFYVKQLVANKALCNSSCENNHKEYLTKHLSKQTYEDSWLATCSNLRECCLCFCAEAKSCVYVYVLTTDIDTMVFIWMVSHYDSLEALTTIECVTIRETKISFHVQFVQIYWWNI